MEPRWRIEMLGGLRAVRGDRVIARFATQKTAALLAYLAYHRRQAHPREVLAELLWPGCLPDAGRNSLRVALSSLRHQLEPPGVAPGAVIAADRSTVQLNPAAAVTDVAEFSAALRQAARAEDPSTEAERLLAAVHLYRGSLLPGHYEDWVIHEQRRLAEAFFQALARVIIRLEESGDLEQALAYAQRGVALDPLRENTHYAAMRLQAALGRRVEALRQFQEWKRIARDEMGTIPSEAMLALARRLEGDRPAPAGRERRAPGERRPDTAPTAPRAAGSQAERAPLPRGSVTFLLADLGESRPACESAGQALPEVVATLDRLLDDLVARHGGTRVRSLAAGFAAAFERAGDALSCTAAGQRQVARHTGPHAPERPALRMALCTGDVEVDKGEYRGGVLERAARVLAAGHSGQVLCSEETAGVVRWDLEPGTRLVDLGVYRLRDATTPERLFQVEHPEAPARRFPPVRAAAGYSCNLPVQLNRFFGREEEIAAARRALLEGGRLVTLTGPGGTGKTRLALEVARSLIEHLGGAVWFVALAEVPDARLIPDRILDALRLPPSPGLDPLEQVAAALAGQPGLLLLDNLEHLVEGAAPIVEGVLARLPSLQCLVTSRRRLPIPGEQEIAVSPLPVPTQSGSTAGLEGLASVQLFVDRARAAQADFALTPVNAPAVAQLCRRLEGVPLALELAAAWAQALTPAQMLARMDRGVDLLVNRQPHVAERHRTLRAAIEWSYRLLAEPLQWLCAELSVFHGGWTEAAAEAVCSLAAEEPGPAAAPREAPGPTLPHPLQVLDGLAQLRECSLILSREAGREMRFGMLETLRRHAGERLDALGAVAHETRRRHAEFYLHFAQQRLRELRTPGEVAALQRLDAELGNLRAAREWSLQSGLPLLATHLAVAAGTFLWRRGRLAEAWRCIEQGQEALRAVAQPPAGLDAELRTLRARLEIDRLDWAAAAQSAGEALASLERLGDRRGEADARNLLGLAARGMGDFAGARRHLARALEQFREVGDAPGRAAVLTNLGLVGNEDPGGDRGAAARCWQEALALRRRLGDRRGTAEVLTNLGILAQQGEDPEGAAHHYEGALEIELELGHVLGVARALCNLGEVAEAKGTPEPAARLLAAAEFLFTRAGSPYQSYVAGQVERVCTASEAAAGTASAFQETACQWSLEELVDWARRSSDPQET